MILRFEELDSTSSYLKSRAAEPLPQFAVVVAANQSAGRGQRGNSWESAPGENLLMSMLFYPPEWLTPDRQFLISQCVALAVADTYEDEVDNAVAGMTAAIEPALIIFLAVVVGTIVVAMFMPMIQIITSVSSGGGGLG